MRDDFEKWYDGFTKDNYGISYYVDAEGKYCHDDIELAWQAWQASLQHSKPVPDERLGAMLESVQDALHDAYQNAGLVCCGKSMMQCCGSPVADWSESDQKIMNVLGPIQQQLSVMLSASPSTEMEPT